MPLYDIGPRAFVEGVGVATLSLTPQADRAAIVKRILIDKPSAGDVWRVTCGGREVAAFDIQTTGNQQPLGGPYSAYPKNNDIFRIVDEVYPDDLIYPVPQGDTLTVASDGGATAIIELSYIETTPQEITQGLVNHPQGRRFILPLVGFINANVAALGEAAFDSQVGPKWFPNIFVDGNLPVNWSARIIAWFLEGGGVNTFSGAANHQSVTSYFACIKNGQRLYTRAALGGIPLNGQASAAGSANVVVGTDQTPYPPLQEADYFDWHVPEQPLIIGGGDRYQFRLNITGDITGGAPYAAVRQLFLCDVRTP